MFLTQNNMELLHIRDVQLRPTPMEEVFMTITKKAELENAEVRVLIYRVSNFGSKLISLVMVPQAEGRFETLLLAEEGIALKIPVGADYIESPGENSFAINKSDVTTIDLAVYCYRWKFLYNQMDKRSLRSPENSRLFS